MWENRKQMDYSTSGYGQRAPVGSALPEMTIKNSDNYDYSEGHGEWLRRLARREEAWEEGTSRGASPPPSLTLVWKQATPEPLRPPHFHSVKNRREDWTLQPLESEQEMPWGESGAGQGAGSVHKRPRSWLSGQRTRSPAGAGRTELDSATPAAEGGLQAELSLLYHLLRGEKMCSPEARSRIPSLQRSLTRHRVRLKVTRLRRHGTQPSYMGHTWHPTEHHPPWSKPRYKWKDKQTAPRYCWSVSHPSLINSQNEEIQTRKATEYSLLHRKPA